VFGGKKSHFKDVSGGAASNFSWQHHVNWHPNNILTIFDNGAADRSIITADYSRGMVVALDLHEMTATLIREYRSPQGFISGSQGSVQIMPETGHVFVGWGHSPAYTEFTADGKILCDVHFGPSMFFNFGWVKSYRAFKSPWVGMPSYPPDVEIDADVGTAYVSWNGATEVAGWITQTAPFPHAADYEFNSIDYTEKEGFETSIELPEDLDEYYIRVAGVDIDGEILGYSRVFDARTGLMVSTDPYCCAKTSPKATYPYITDRRFCLMYPPY
jgi:Arylsulfotransferase (ASST).